MKERYFLRLWVYIYDAWEDEIRVAQSYVDGTQKIWYTGHDTEIKGRVRFLKQWAIYFSETKEGASEKVKGIIKYIRKNHPLFTVDFTFSKVGERRNEEIYSGVL